MARTAVTPTRLAAGAATAKGDDADSGLATIDATLVSNGVQIPTSDRLHDLVIRAKNTAVADKTVTAKAAIATGYGQAVGGYHQWLAAQGDLTLTVAAGAEVYITGLESARFEQGGADADRLWLDFESGFTGELEVLLLPRTPY